MMGQRMGSRVRERWESAGSLREKWGGGENHASEKLDDGLFAVVCSATSFVL